MQFEFSKLDALHTKMADITVVSSSGDGGISLVLASLKLACGSMPPNERFSQ